MEKFTTYHFQLKLAATHEILSVKILINDSMRSIYTLRKISMYTVSLRPFNLCIPLTIYCQNDKE